MNRIVKKTVSFLFAVLMLFFCQTTGHFRPAAVTDENNVGGGTGNPVGSAKEGRASYTNVNTMWKISVYVARRDTVTNAGSYTLTDDYYKFGYTFWLYRDGYAIDNFSTDQLSRLYLELNNKEEYVNGGASFTQARYSSVSGRVFKGSAEGLTGQNAVPVINNFGTDSIADTRRFFEGNKTVSDKLVELAARAAGTTPERILRDLTFTVNGETKSGWDLKMVDLRTGADGVHTSCVSWVFLYEPVVLINGTNITGYYHGVTATGVAAAMWQGVYNWTSSAVDFERRFKNTADRPVTPAVFWGLGTDFPMVNLPNSAFLESDWLGYRSGTYWQNEYNGGARTWYVESQFSGGGFGLRYQRAELPTVILQKTVDGGKSGSLEGFVFTVTNQSTGESWTSATTDAGTVTLYLPPGTYTVTEAARPGYQPFKPQSFTVPASATQSSVIRITVNNETVRTGTLTVTKFADDADFSDTFFRITGPEGIDFSLPADGTDGAHSYAGGKLPITYTYQTVTMPSGEQFVRITLENCPFGSYTVTETRPARYDLTYVRVNGRTRQQALSASADVTADVSPEIRFDNYAKALATGYLQIYKSAEDLAYDDISYRITGPYGIDFTVPATGPYASFGFYTYDSQKDPIEYRFFSFDSGEKPSMVRKDLVLVTVSKLPPGTYTVTEIRPDRYGKTLVSVNGGEQTESLTVGAEVVARSTEVIRFENRLARFGSLEIVKTSTDGQVGGVQFTVTGPNGYSETFTTDAGGRILIEKLEPGVYTVSENGDETVYYVPEDQTVTVAEKETAHVTFENVNKRTVTVRYLDKYTGREIADAYRAVDRQGAAYDVTLQAQLFFSGYDFVDRVEGDPVKGTLNTDKEIDVYYGYNHTVTVNYYDKYTNDEIAGSHTETKEHGTAYDVTAQTTKSQSGYDFIDRTEGDAAKGTLDADKEINVYYGYNHKITVRYFDKYTNREIAARYETTAEHNTLYNMKDKTEIMQPGYTMIDRTEGDAVSGTLDEDKVIDVYYGYGFNVTVNYYDKYDGHSIAKSYTYAGENGTPYDVTEETEISIAGYDFVDRVEGDDVSGTLDKSKVINVYYGYNNKITVRYFDKYTNREIAARYETTAEHNTLYNVTDKTQILQPGYTMIDRVEGDEASGTLDEDKVIDVYYGYGFTVTVNYYDKYTGSSIAKSYVLEGENMTPYDVTKEAGISIVGYDFIDRVEGDPVKGTLDKSKVINVYYGYNHTITVNYYDKYTNEKITTSYETEAEHNTHYDVTAKTQILQPGYTSIDRVEGDEASGTLDEDKVIDVYYGYGFTVTVNYYDKYDNHSIEGSYIYEGENLTPYDVTARTKISISGYDFIDRVEGDPVTGTLDRNKVINVYYGYNHTVTVNYYDKYTGQKITASFETEAEHGTPYDVLAKRLETVSANGIAYRLDSVTGDAFTGTLDADKVINLYYGYRHTVTVNYYDKYTGSSIAESYVWEGEHNAAYDVTAQATVLQRGYDFIDRTAGDAVNGTLDKDKVINVYYGYNHTVTVNYYDKYTGQKIIASFETEAEHGTIYDVLARRLEEISANGIAYRLDSVTGDAFTGTLDKDKVINLYYLYDQEITLVKRIRIDEIVFAHGTPTFFLTLTDKTGRSFTRTYVFTEEYVKDYLAAHPGAEYVEMAFSFPEMPAGSYTVTEGTVMRYELAENGVTFREGTGTASGGKADFLLSSDNKAVTVVYTNRKTDQSGTSHNDIVVNHFTVSETAGAGKTAKTAKAQPEQNPVKTAVAAAGPAAGALPEQKPAGGGTSVISAVSGAGGLTKTATTLPKNTDRTDRKRR